MIYGFCPPKCKSIQARNHFYNLRFTCFVTVFNKYAIQIQTLTAAIWLNEIGPAACYITHWVHITLTREIALTGYCLARTSE